MDLHDEGGTAPTGEEGSPPSDTTAGRLLGRCCRSRSLSRIGAC